LPNEKINGCAGLFVSTPGELELIVCLDNPRRVFISTLVHEFSHATQYVENIPLWDVTERYHYVYDNEHKWETYNKKLLKQTFTAFKMIELDCEKRSVELIKRFNLPIDIKHYIQLANAYIYYYDILPITKRWCGQQSPCQIEEIVNAMPTNFNRKYKKLPGKYRKLYMKHYKM